MYLYAPLAHRLGLYAIKSELEDLYLKYTESATYREIARNISTTKAARSKFIRQFTKPIEEELRKFGLRFVIKGRPKSIYSIWNKMRKQNIPFEEVYDLFAIRVIVDADEEQEKAACWQVYSVVTDFYKPNPDRLRDWISTPKANGYESLHTTVMSSTGQWVEVQIRTSRMDEIAEKGYAAHWKYKELKGAPSKEMGLEMWISRVREMLEASDASAIEFVDDFRSNLFQEEVFVFTPKGELKTLPTGATALDFAFDIHTEVGAHCIGAKVNQRLVPLNHPLKNGDQVEILTSEKQKPHEDWLRFVVSSKAKARIKECLREDKKKAAIDGREIVERKLKQMKLHPSQEIINQLRAFFDCKTSLDFYYKVGTGEIDPKDVKRFREFKHERLALKKPEIHDARTFEQEIKKAKSSEQDYLLIGEDMNVVDYKLSRCCSPIPGDDVFGFVTVNEGIKIHRVTCPNAVELLSNYGYRVVKAKWTSRQKIAFLAGLRIDGVDRVGLINDITRIISDELHVNMQSMSIETEDGIFEGSIRLYVNDTRHLDLLIKKLEKVEGVNKAFRFN